MMKVIVFVSMLLAAAFAQSYVTHTANLEADQVTSNVTSDAWGVAALTYDQTSKLLSWYIMHNVASPTAIHFHGPSHPGEDGGVLVTIAATAAAAASPVVGSATLTSDQATALNAGQVYINVHSTPYPGGEARGQVNNVGQVTVELDGNQQVPTAVSTAARGWALVTFNNATSTISWNIVHTVTSPTAIHIHGPADESETGGVLVTLAANAAAAASPVSGSMVISSTIAGYLFNAETYFNVHSTDYPNGEIRAQIEVPVSHAAFLNGNNQVPANNSPGKGVALFRLYENEDIESDVMHNLTATAVHIHGPANSTSTAGVILSYSYTNDIYEDVSSSLSSTEDSYIEEEMTYFNVHTDAYTGGEIRGQIMVVGGLNSPSTTAGSTTTSSTTGAASTLCASVAFVVAALALLL